MNLRTIALLISTLLFTLAVVAWSLPDSTIIEIKNYLGL